jgi:hypothetical protein
MTDSPLKVEQDWEKQHDVWSPSVEVARVGNDDQLERMPVDRKVRRKIDFHILPLVTLLYLCSFLWVLHLSVLLLVLTLGSNRDRANIGAS